MELSILRAFIHVYEGRSFSEAARSLGLSRSMVSKHISTLEASLGARLLTRSTRAVRPTDLGTRYYLRVKPLLEELAHAEEEIRSIASRPRGKLRIGAPVWYMLRFLSPYVMQFMEAYPDIELDLMLDEGASDPVAKGLDAVIQMGALADSSLHARRIHSVRACVVASPRYLAEAGTPLIPSDLLNHRCLHHSSMPGAETWPFSHGDEIIYQKVRVAFSANNGEMLRAAALDGLGVAVAIWLGVEEDIAAGRLVQLLPEFTLPDLPVHLVHPGKRHATGALLAFMEFLTQQRLEAGPPHQASTG